MSSISKRPEQMASFFDVRADGYDQHMADNIDPRFYDCIGECIEPTGRALRVLDLGCGTGLEISGILRNAPRAEIVGVDLSDRMLEKLQRKYEAYAGQISVIRDSYLSMDMGVSKYDYVVSAQTMHHLLPETKVTLYKRVRAALKPFGSYIEADYMVSATEESERLKIYYEKMQALGDSRDGQYHIDIPFSVETQARLLREAGFGQVREVLRSENAGILVALNGTTCTG